MGTSVSGWTRTPRQGPGFRSGIVTLARGWAADISNGSGTARSNRSPRGARVGRTDHRPGREDLDRIRGAALRPAGTAEALEWEAPRRSVRPFLADSRRHPREPPRVARTRRHAGGTP